MILLERKWLGAAELGIARMGSARVKIRGMSVREYGRFESLRKNLEPDDPDLAAHILACGIVTWDGFRDGDGEPLASDLTVEKFVDQLDFVTAQRIISHIIDASILTDDLEKNLSSPQRSAPPPTGSNADRADGADAAARPDSNGSAKTTDRPNA